MKFELTAESIEKYGRKLFRIRALIDFTTDQGNKVTKGDFGGYIERAETLNQSGNAWIFTDAIVFKESTIRGGTIRGGDIRGGTIRGGTIRGGDIRGGTIRGGDIRGGTIWGGDIWGGDIRGGDIRGGTIRGGTN